MPWTAKLPKMAQPDLDFIAPEVQIGGKPCTFSCDLFSLGMLICAIYNKGQSLINAAHNPAMYTKKIEQVGLSHNLSAICPRPDANEFPG